MHHQTYGSKTEPGAFSTRHGGPTRLIVRCSFLRLPHSTATAELFLAMTFPPKEAYGSVKWGPSHYFLQLFTTGQTSPQRLSVHDPAVAFRRYWRGRRELSQFRVRKSSERCSGFKRGNDNSALTFRKAVVHALTTRNAQLHGTISTLLNLASLAAFSQAATLTV
jgi:hypothetical protein